MEENLIRAIFLFTGVIIGMFIGVFSEKEDKKKETSIRNPFYNPNKSTKKCWSCDKQISPYEGDRCSRCIDKSFGY